GTGSSSPQPACAETTTSSHMVLAIARVRATCGARERLQMIRTALLATLLVGCTASPTKDPEDTDTVDTDQASTACVLPEVDTGGEDAAVDERLLRWPYTSHVTDTEITVHWGLPAG